jgi:hypothetical protein
VLYVSHTASDAAGPLDLPPGTRLQLPTLNITTTSLSAAAFQYAAVRAAVRADDLTALRVAAVAMGRTFLAASIPPAVVKCEQREVSTAAAVADTLLAVAERTHEHARTLTPTAALHTACAVASLLASPVHVDTVAAAATRRLLGALLAALGDARGSTGASTAALAPLPGAASAWECTLAALEALAAAAALNCDAADAVEVQAAQVHTATLLTTAAQLMAATLDPGAPAVSIAHRRTTAPAEDTTARHTFAAAAAAAHGAAAATARIPNVAALKATPLGTLQELGGRVSITSTTTAAVALLPPDLLWANDNNAVGQPVAVAGALGVHAAAVARRITFYAAPPLSSLPTQTVLGIRWLDASGVLQPLPGREVYDATNASVSVQVYADGVYSMYLETIASNPPEPAAPTARTTALPPMPPTAAVAVLRPEGGDGSDGGGGGGGEGDPRVVGVIVGVVAATVGVLTVGATLLWRAPLAKSANGDVLMNAGAQTHTLTHSHIPKSTLCPCSCGSHS